MLLELIPFVIGLTLGLLGGGGAVLCVPVLIYIFGLGVKSSIAISLIVIGFSSLIGALYKIFKKEILLKETLWFGFWGMLGSFLTAKFLAPLLSDSSQMILFAVFMVLMGVLMLKQKNIIDSSLLINKKVLSVISFGLGTGAITGLLGIGGGFLIVPVLTLFLNFPMRKAIASSFLIISMQAFTGFFAYLGLVDLDYDFVVKFTLISIVGVFIGIYFSKLINEDVLKKIFGLVLILLAAYILLKG
jgi:uncharacterized membrane protein YfcA